MNKINVVLITSLCLFISSCEKPKVNNGITSNKEESMAQVSEVSAKHILVNTEQEAIDLYNQISNGQITFEEAAAKFSKCPSGKSEGNLGFFGKGMMVKEFEDAAFALDIGQISKPVKTQFGWHLIKVEAKR